MLLISGCEECEQSLAGVGGVCFASWRQPRGKQVSEEGATEHNAEFDQPSLYINNHFRELPSHMLHNQSAVLFSLLAYFSMKVYLR